MGRRVADRLEHGNPRPRMLHGLLVNKGYEPRPFSTSQTRDGRSSGRARRTVPDPGHHPGLVSSLPRASFSVSRFSKVALRRLRFSPCACVRKVRDILLGGRRTAGRLQIGPDLPNMENLLAHARTNASIIIHNAEWAQHSWCAVRNKFGNISKRKTSFPFPCRVGSTPAGWDGVQWAGQETDRGRWESGRRPGRRSTSRGSRSFWGSWRRPCRRCLRRRSPRARPRR